MQPNWQPLSALSAVAALMDEGLTQSEEQLATWNEVRDRARRWQQSHPPREEQLATRNEVRDKPAVLDDATIARAERLFGDEWELLAFYEAQLARWMHQPLRAEQEHEITRLRNVLARTRSAVAACRQLVEEMNGGTIESVLRSIDDLTSPEPPS